MRAKKSFGQHFLASPGVIQSIVQTAKIGPKEAILEIGPGRGVLTETLLLKARYVVAVEKDPELVAFLKGRFAKEIQEQKLFLVQRDALRFNPSEHPALASGYKLVANIPYYITGAIIERLLTGEPQPSSMTLLVQKEVAERVVAREEKESVLSLSVKAYGTPHYIQTVKAGSFSPPPKVDSAILSITNISRDFFVRNNIDEKKFFNLVKKGFAHKRKKLSSNLGVSEDILTTLGITPNVRAEELSIQIWQRLYNILAQKQLEPGQKPIPGRNELPVTGVITPKEGIGMQTGGAPTKQNGGTSGFLTT
jgi:16S rRNA (adenine1518-N6/adenine1519-N6)-dimethyltransferase